MRTAQGLDRQGRDQSTRVPDFKPIGEQHYLHRVIGSVVAVHDRVDEYLRPASSDRSSKVALGHPDASNGRGKMSP
jgi:hypothetical protein